MAMHGVIFQGVKCENFPKGNLQCTRKGKAVVLVSLARMGRHEQQRRTQLCSMSKTRSCSRWEYEGEGKQWAEEEVDRAGGNDCSETVAPWNN